MPTVGIAELKNRLSYYLRRVQRGELILVRDRDRVIARIERVASHGAGVETDAEWLDRLEVRGVLRRGAGPPTRVWLARRPAVGVDAVRALVRERDESP